MARAILANGIRPEERVFCTGGATFYGRFFRCHGHHGSVDLVTALQVSCDTYFYTMGKRLGIDAIAENGNLFGFGRPTGIDLLGEKSGVLPSPEWSLKARKHPWYAGETISVAIGQGPVLVTALQVARAFAGIANGDGALPTPHLFHIGENVRTRERFVYRPPVKEFVPWPPGARELVVEGLWRVVNAPGGTAYSVHVPGLDICGKTGTVQVVAQKEARKAYLLPGGPARPRLVRLVRAEGRPEDRRRRLRRARPPRKHRRPRRSRRSSPRRGSRAAPDSPATLLAAGPAGAR